MFFSKLMRIFAHLKQLFYSNIIKYEEFMAPEKGSDTRVKITDAVEDFMKKHNIKLSRKEVVDLVDDIEDATEEE